MRELNRRDGYQEIKTPLLYNKGLWEIPGHWGKYRENMFLVLDNETGEHDFSLKPMNCPSHHLMYRHEEAQLSRAAAWLLHLRRAAPERSVGRTRRAHAGAPVSAGRLPHLPDGTARSRPKCSASPRFILELLPDLRSHGDAQVRHAPRAAHRRRRRCGIAPRRVCAAALEATGLPYELKPGDGAFYGPKIDFDVADSIGRKWQLGTIQLDYAAPERFDLTYVGEDNAEHRPVVIHRAMSGSFERFIAILIEHFAGAFPVWLAPEQVRVIPISDAQRDGRTLLAAAVAMPVSGRTLDERNETLNYRIRDGEMWKVPYMAVVGQREADGDSLAVRVRGAGNKQEVMGPRVRTRRGVERGCTVVESEAASPRDRPGPSGAAKLVGGAPRSG